MEGVSQREEFLFEAVPEEALVGLVRPFAPGRFGPSAGTFTSPMPMQFLHKSPLGNLPKPKQLGHLVVFVTLMPKKKQLRIQLSLGVLLSAGNPSTLNFT
jgi:hypothetical protein